jgi:hypothetical protein
MSDQFRWRRGGEPRPLRNFLCRRCGRGAPADRAEPADRRDRIRLVYHPNTDGNVKQAGVGAILELSDTVRGTEFTLALRGVNPRGAVRARRSENDMGDV